MPIIFPPRLALGVLPLAYATVWAGLQRMPVLPGDYSYGLYLVGYPLQQLYVSLFPGGPWWNTFFVCLPLGLGLAAVLWHTVERPVLTNKKRFVPRLRLRPLGQPLDA